MRCTHGASLAEPRLLGKAWLREATRCVLIAPRRGAHFKKWLRNYLRRPEIKKNSWGVMSPDPPSWCAYARIKYITRSSTPKLNVLSTAPASRHTQNTTFYLLQKPIFVSATVCICCSAQTGQHERCKRECCPVWALQQICWTFLSNRHV